MSDLWKHQRDFIELARRIPNLGAIMDPGTGKTRAVIEVLREDYRKHGRIRPTLIFAPISVCPGWAAQFGIYSLIAPEKVLVLTGSGASRKKELETQLARNPNCIVVTNYEAVQITQFYQVLLKWNPRIIVLDEFHRLKNPSSVRLKKIRPLADTADRKIGMTGTLTPNSYLDIYGPFKTMAPESMPPSFWHFRNVYFYDKNARMPAHIHFPDWQPKAEAAEQIGKIVAKYCIQAKKSECLDLPPLIEQIIPVKLEGLQSQVYKRMEKDFIAELKGVVSVAQFALTKTLRLQQIIAGFLHDVDSGEPPQWFDNNHRMEVLADLIDSLGKEPFLLWTTFQPTYAKLGELCEKMGRRPVYLTGEQTAAEKQEGLRQFKSGEADTVIANPAAAGEGIDGLQLAKYAVYYTRGYNATHFEQSKARNYRGGSEKHEKITHYHLMAPGSVDEIIAGALMRKKNLSEDLLEWAKKCLALNPFKY